MRLSWRIFETIYILQLYYVLETTCQRTTHRFNTLTSRRARTVAQCSNVDNIKTSEIPNILKVRVPDTPEHTEVKQYLISRLNQLNKTYWDISLDTFIDKTPFGNKRFTNIIATLDPHKSKRLVLAAHYDSKYFNNIKFLGATDSAIPVGIILDLILTLDEKLQNRDLQEHSLQVILFDGEEAFVEWTDEDSLYGSRHLAELMSRHDSPYTVQGKTGIEAIEAFVLLDLIGSTSPHPQFYDMYESGSKLFERLKKIEKKLKDEGQLIHHSRNYFVEHSVSGYSVQDDHVPFFNRGVPIVHLIPIPFPYVWHKSGDNYNAIDWDMVENFKKILMIFLYEYFHLH